MKAMYLTGIGQFAMQNIPAPAAPGADEVLLQVDVVGVCGSDVHYFRDGKIGCQVVQFPWIVGHEFGATVLQVGDDVCGLKRGQRVAVDPLVACHECDQCRAGRIHTCRNQKFMGCPGQLPGSMVERLVLPAACCFPLPNGLTAEQAALSEPLSIGLHARNLAGVREGGQVAILGSGPIGLCVLAALMKAEPCDVYMTDLLDNRLDLAEQFGAQWTGNAATQDVAAEILQCQPLGMDVIFECAGKQETIDQAVELLAPGGTLVLVGIPTDDRIGLDMNLLRRKELRVQCVRRQNECLAEALEMLSSGEIDLDGLVTHRFNLAQSQQAFELVRDYRDGVVKAMIEIAPS